MTDDVDIPEPRKPDAADNLRASAVTFEESGHIALKHTDCDKYNCQFCDGGLFACTRCDSFEGATTTHCPGYSFLQNDWKDTDKNMHELVYAGKLDYRFGNWIEVGSPHTPNRGWDLETGEPC